MDLDILEIVAWYYFICVRGWENTARFSRRIEWKNHGSECTASLPLIFIYREQPSSEFAQDLRAVTSSPQYRSVKSIAELFARATWSFVTVKTQHLWPILNEAALNFEEMTSKLQDTWRQNPWVDIQAEEEIPEFARDILTQAWDVLKTILFATVMVQQSVVTATIYLPPPPTKTVSSREPNIMPAPIAWTILQGLSNLSFVITKFGGVTSTSRTPVFPQLRRLFYSALDVLSADQASSEKFVIYLLQTGKKNTTPSKSSKMMENAKMAFSLACIEQLVPKIDDEGVQSRIFDICIPYVILSSADSCFMDDTTFRNLWDYGNREVYESSHSVVLALLAAHTQGIGDGVGTSPATSIRLETKSNGKDKVRAIRPLAEKIIPFYTNCLLEVNALLLYCFSGLTCLFSFQRPVAEFCRRSVGQCTTAHRFCGRHSKRRIL